MRLGLSSSLTHQTPEEWAERLSALGCRAVNFPVDYTGEPSLLDRYAKAAQEHDLLIAEVGAWCNPISPDPATRKAALLRCKEQLRFAVHMDVFNWITSAQRYFFHEELMEECFTKLGTHIKSCHLKNVHLSQAFTLQLQETACEKGDLHLEKYAQLIEHLDPDMPVIIEHLESDAEYLESLAYVIQRFRKAGYSL